MGMGLRTGVVVVWLLATGGLRAQTSQAARHVVDTMLMHVGNEGEHSNLYMYVSEERSTRTGGHLWTERVAETSVGKVRLLVGEHYNHFELPETLGNPYGLLGRAALDLMGLTAGVCR